MMTTLREYLGDWRAKRDIDTLACTHGPYIMHLGPLPVPLPNPGQLHWHDLHHIALGYEPNICGELEMSAFELRSGVRTPVVLFLCLGGIAVGLLIAPRRVLAAWRRARGKRKLYGCGLPYESVLDWSEEELRAWMGLNEAMHPRIVGCSEARVPKRTGCFGAL